MRIRNLISCAALCAIVVFAVGHVGGLGVRISPPRDRTTLTMEVSDINGLVVGSNVLLRGVAIGKVTAIRANPEAASIDFYVEGTHQIPVNSIVRLDNLSALGEAYIGFFPQTGDGPMLRSGARIASKAIQKPPSFADLAISMGRFLEQADPAQLSAIVAEADAALGDPDAILPNIGRAAMLLRAEIATMGGCGQELLTNIQALLHNAGVVAPALASLAPHLKMLGPNMQGIFAGAMGIVAADSPEALRRFKAYLERIQNFLDTRSPDIKVMAETLLPNIRNVGSALANIDTGRVLANMLAAVPEDGAITLNVSVRPPG